MKCFLETELGYEAKNASMFVMSLFI